MRSLLVAVAVGAISVATVPAGAAPVSLSAACRPAGDASLVATSAELVVTRRSTDDEGTNIPGSLYSACDRRNGRRSRLEDPAVFHDTDVYIRDIQLRGRYVSYVFGTQQSCSQCGPGNAEVKSLNARSGRHRRVGPTARGGANLVPALVSDSHGRLAWTSSTVDPQAATPRPLTTRQLRKFDAAGPGQISADPGLNLENLRLTDAKLTWQEASVERFRVLR